jgi:hypothetical protein
MGTGAVLLELTDQLFPLFEDGQRRERVLGAPE